MSLRACLSTPCGLDLKSAFKALRRPLHITIVQGEKYIKKITIRPLLLLCVGIAVVVAVGLFLSVQDKKVQSQPHITQLQYEQRHLTSKLSATEAMLALRDSELENMQQELVRNTHAMHAMQLRLDMFDDVLAARKIGGWHILHPTATWLDERTIAYQLAVVKGENYPRWAKGHISFSVIGLRGESIELGNKRGKKSLKFDMRTHAFFEGVIPWSKSWQAKTLVISLFDKRGRNNQKLEIPILMRKAALVNTSQSMPAAKEQAAKQSIERAIE